MSTAVYKHDALRLENLERYDVCTPSLDPHIDGITQLAAKLCNAPIAGISFVGADRIWVPSRFGMTEHEMPLGSLPTTAATRREGIHEIADTRHHPDFMPTGVYIGDRPYRFYTGVSLVTPEDIRIGSLFVIDIPARKLTSYQLSALTVLARQVMICLELNALTREMERSARARQRVESALTVERNFVSTVLDTVDALVAVFDTAGRIVRFNRACETASGYDFSNIVGRYLWDQLIPEADVPAAVENFERLRADGSPTAFESRWAHRDGSVRRIAWSASGLFDDQGQVNFIIATGIDVTVQRAAEETLRESEARYRQLVEGSLGIVFTHDLEGNILSVNTHGAQSLGRTQEDLVGHPLTGLISAERRDQFPAYLETIQAEGEAQGLLYLCHVDGEVRNIAYRNKLIKIPAIAGAPARDPYVLGFGVDITEQVKAEEQLRSVIRQSNSILESVGDGIYGMDLNGIVTVINPAAAQMLGYKSEEILGRNMHTLIHHTRADGRAYPAAESPISNTIADLDTVRISNEVFWRKDGSSFPVEYVARPQIEVNVENPAGKAVGVVVAFTDTTERRALDRMKDEFISTVSHELRTPLTSIRAALGLVTGGTLASRPEKIQQMLDIATGNTDRLVRLVNDILELERIGSGKAELHYTMCSADDLFRRAAGLQQTGAAKAHLRITFNSQGVNIWADPDRILQTLTNLISNAIKFSSQGGEIHLQARRVSSSEAEILVQDQGRGIPADKLESIFERFQQVDASDSRAMGGTGLGLAICRSIIAQHGGRIWATSEPGQGATFHLTLPTKPASNLL